MLADQQINDIHNKKHYKVDSATVGYMNPPRICPN